MASWKFIPNGTCLSLDNLSGSWDPSSEMVTISDTHGSVVIRNGTKLAAFIIKDQLCFGEIERDNWNLSRVRLVQNATFLKPSFNILRTGGGLGISDLRSSDRVFHHFNLRITPLEFDISASGNDKILDLWLVPLSPDGLPLDNPNPLAYTSISLDEN